MEKHTETSSTSSILLGIDLSKLEPEIVTKPVPQMVRGRWVHIDADFLAYQVSYDDEKGLPNMKHNCDMAIEKIRLFSGAEFVQLHLTPKGSTKGGRFDIALLKEYQANRKDKPKPKYLHVMRDWMHKERGAVLYPECEADDGMSMAQYKSIGDKKHNLSIIATKDKDLCMVPGLALNWDTLEVTDTGKNFFGKLWIDDTKSQKKLKGRGEIFFWAQMLMGDTADNISGLPMVVTPKYLKGKPKKIGPMLTYEILQDVKTNKEAFEIVRGLYKDYGEAIGFTNWRDGSPVTSGQAFTSEAQLCWMRRKNTITDCLDWMKENCL